MELSSDYKNRSISIDRFIVNDLLVEFQHEIINHSYKKISLHKTCENLHTKKETSHKTINIEGVKKILPLRSKYAKTL